MKIFSLVALYNQYRFEKELDENLTDLKNQEEEINLQQPLNPNNEYALNNTCTLLQIQPEIQDDNLNFEKLYSFNTFKELYKNNKLLMGST